MWLRQLGIKGLAYLCAIIDAYTGTHVHEEIGLGDERELERDPTHSRQKTCPHAIEQGALPSPPKGSRHTSQTEPGPRQSMDGYQVRQRDVVGASDMMRRGNNSPERELKEGESRNGSRKQANAHPYM